MKAFVVFLAFTLSLCLSTGSTDVSLDAPNPDKWFKISGAPTGSFSGRVVSNIGDFNGDGVDDMIMNSPQSSQPEVIYVIYGQKDGYSKDTIWVNSMYSEGFAIRGSFINSGSSSFGFAVSKAIDLNGDGLCDIVLGDYGYSSGQGIVYVIYGKKGHTGDITINQDLSLSSSSGFVILGPQTGQLGYSVSSAGDFNGDGFDDLLIGAPGYQSMGAVYIIYGKKGNSANIYLNETSSSQQVFTIFGSAGSTCRFGISMEGVGDINGDNVDDILVGASSCYSVYGLYGKKNRAETTLTIDSSLGTSKGFVISSAAAFGQFGMIMSSAGDINGDGIQDIILGTHVPSSVVTRGAYVFYGRKGDWSSFEVDSGYVSNQGFMIKDSSSQILSCGVAVSGGDINGDGLDDILVRARNKISGGGYVAVIYGSQTTFTGVFDISTDLTADKGFLVSGSAINLQMPTKSIATGDLNNDHIDDIIIGAPQSASTGEAYVVFGFNGCPRNCSTCFSSSCLSCFEGYGLYESSCIECPLGTFLSEERICQECPESCTACTSSSKCQACADGYSLSGSQSCISEDKETISKSQETQTAVSTGLFDGVSAISNALAIGSSVPTNFGLVAKILRNTKYLNVSVSEELQKTFNSWKISTGIFPAPDSESSDSGSLPLMFERYDMDKAFLINYWKSLMMILIGLGLFMICKGAEVIFAKNSSVQKITRTVNVVASNFMLTQFYGSIDDILLYSVIDMRSGEFTSSAFRTFGFILGLGLLVVGFVATGVHGMILFKYQRIKKQGGGAATAQINFLLQFLKKYENLKLFFQDFKDIDVFQQAFLLINVVRSLLSSFIFTMLFRYPLLQILLLIALNISILIFLFTKKPFKDLANAYAQYFCEGILLLAYLSILVLAFLDEAESEASKAIEGFSMIVIVSNLALLVGSAIFMLVNIGQILYGMYKERRQKKSAFASTSTKDVVLISTIHSRLDSHQKINDLSADNFLKPNNTTLDYSNSLNTSGFNLIPNENTTSSPDLGPRRRIRRDTVQRRTHTPVIKPSMRENHIPPMHSSPFVLHTPGDLQLEHGSSSFGQSSFRLNQEEIQQETIVENIAFETPQLEARMRNRGYSVPMRPLLEIATHDRGLPVVMEGEETQFNSKKTKLENAPNNFSLYPSSFLINTHGDSQSECGDSSFTQSNFWMNPEPTQNNFVLETAQLEARTRNRGYSVPMGPLHGVVIQDTGLSVVIEGEETNSDLKKMRIKKIRR